MMTRLSCPEIPKFAGDPKPPCTSSSSDLYNKHEWQV